MSPRTPGSSGPETAGTGPMPDPEQVRREQIISEYVDGLGDAEKKVYEGIENDELRNLVNELIVAVKESNETARLAEARATEAEAAKVKAEAAAQQAIGGRDAYADMLGKRKNGNRLIGAVALVAVGAAAVFGTLYFTGKDDKAEASPAASGAEKPGVDKAKPDADKAGDTNVANKGQVGPASKLNLSDAEYKRLAPVANNPNVDTAEEAADAYRSSNADQAAQDILGNPEAFKNVDISHYLNRMNSVSGDESIQTMKALEIIYIGIVQSEGYSKAAANVVEGADMTSSRSDSHADQIELVRKFALAEGTEIDGNFDLTKLWDNGRIMDGTENVQSSVEMRQGERAIRIHNKDGRELIVKLDADGSIAGLCFNIQEKVTARTSTSSVSRTFVHRSTPPSGEETTPPPKKTKKIVKNHRRSVIQPGTGDEDREIEIPAPAVAPQPAGAPAVDPYEAVAPTPEARPADIIAGDQDPRGGAATTGETVATPTPATEGGNTDGNASGVQSGTAPESEAEPANQGTVTY